MARSGGGGYVELVSGFGGLCCKSRFALVIKNSKSLFRNCANASGMMGIGPSVSMFAYRQLWNVVRRGHSGLMLAARITLPHFSAVL
jgi:hypothetical protein